MAINTVTATLRAIAASYHSTAVSVIAASAAVASFALNWSRREAAGRKAAVILGVAVRGIVGFTPASAASASTATVQLADARCVAEGQIDLLNLLISATVPLLEAPT